MQGQAHISDSMLPREVIARKLAFLHACLNWQWSCPPDKVHEDWCGWAVKRVETLEGLLA